MAYEYEKAKREVCEEDIIKLESMASLDCLAIKVKKQNKSLLDYVWMFGQRIRIK